MRVTYGAWWDFGALPSHADVSPKLAEIAIPMFRPRVAPLVTMFVPGVACRRRWR